MVLLDQFFANNDIFYYYLNQYVYLFKINLKFTEICCYFFKEILRIFIVFTIKFKLICVM